MTLNDFKVGDRWVDAAGDEHEIITIKYGFVVTWFEGRPYACTPEQNFLVKKVVPKLVRYANLYRTDGYIYETRREADEAASKDRLACIRIEFEAGQYDE